MDDHRRNKLRDEARKRALHLTLRMSPEGYFIANDAGHPFWHASDAGMPVVALARFIDKEKDPNYYVPAKNHPAGACLQPAGDQ